MSCDENCGIAAYPMPCTVQGMTLREITFTGTIEGDPPDLTEVSMTVSVEDEKGILLEIDSGARGGMTITDPATWSFKIDQIDQVDLPVGCLEYTIAQTYADGTESVPFQGTWTIKEA